MFYFSYGIRREYKNHIRDAIKTFKSEYPVINEIVKVIHCKKVGRGMEYCFATTRIIWGFKLRFEIKLNPKAFSRTGIRDKFLLTDGANYESVEDIIYHELGHCLQIFMLCKEWNLNLKKYNYFNYFKYKELNRSKKAINTYTDYIGKFLIRFDWNQEKAALHLGTYAAENPWEILPECYNNYYRLNGKYILNPIEKETYEFVKTVIEDYKKYIPKQ